MYKYQIYFIEWEIKRAWTFYQDINIPTIVMRNCQEWTMIYTIAIFLYYQCFTLPIFSVMFLCKQMCIFMLGHLNLPFVFILIFWKTIPFKDSCYIVHNNISVTDIKCMKNNKITLRCFNYNLGNFYYIKICLISVTIKNVHYW